MLATGERSLSPWLKSSLHRLAALVDKCRHRGDADRSKYGDGPILVRVTDLCRGELCPFRSFHRAQETARSATHVPGPSSFGRKTLSVSGTIHHLIEQYGALGVGLGGGIEGESAVVIGGAMAREGMFSTASAGPARRSHSSAHGCRARSSSSSAGHSASPDSSIALPKNRCSRAP